MSGVLLLARFAKKKSTLISIQITTEKISTQIIVDNDYAALITSLQHSVRSAQLKAHRAVNTELIKLYWTIGKQLLEQQKVKAWGSKYVEWSVGI